MGLFQIYQEGDSGFLKAYDKLMRNSGEGTAAELASRFGIELNEPAFWENGLRIIEKRIERYLEI
jgi:oligoendopeptidase F